jgi:5-formyltetrahydrofolate cyclo-ligase
MRRSMSADEVASASVRVVEHLLGLTEIREAGAVLLYAADPDEIDVTPLIDVVGLQSRVLLPRVDGDQLATVEHRPGEPLVVGPFGVREPSGPALGPSDVTIDVVVVPGVAFGSTGVRLGRGGGFYDRLLPELPSALRIGVCAERFILDDLPVEEHDVGMDLVVSDAAVRRGDAAVRPRDAAGDAAGRRKDAMEGGASA